MLTLLNGYVYFRCHDQCMKQVLKQLKQQCTKMVEKTAKDVTISNIMSQHSSSSFSQPNTFYRPENA